MRKKKAVIIIAYLSFLFISFIYINNVLKKEEVENYEEEEEKEVKKEYPVTVTLKLYEGNTVKEYKRESTNLESVEEFLHELRSNEGLLYESTRYTYGNEISSVFKTPPNDGYKWALLLDGKDVTLHIDDVDVGTDQVYELKMIER